VQHVINGPNFAVKIETMSLFLEYPPRNPHKHARSDARTHARTEMRAPSPLCATRLRFGADGEESLKARRLVDSCQVLHTGPMHRRFTLGLKGAGRNWFGRAPGLCGGGGEVNAQRCVRPLCWHVAHSERRVACRASYPVVSCCPWHAMCPAVCCLHTCARVCSRSTGCRRESSAPSAAMQLA
jgi:hypothetical protein